jgi:hypothetical protein
MRELLESASDEQCSDVFNSDRLLVLLCAGLAAVL